MTAQVHQQGENGSVPDDSAHHDGVPNAGAHDSGGHRIVTQISPASQRTLDLIRRLCEPLDRATYKQRIEETKSALGVSTRTVQRLLRAYEEKGVDGIARDDRADKGRHRVSPEWQRFILDTYRAGNRGGKRMLPAQVAERVEGEARRRGLPKGQGAYPSRMTVYRMLTPLENERKKPAQVRRRGWRDGRLAIRTRAGDTIEVTHSNQVWQIDHTQVTVFVLDEDGVPRRPYVTTVVDTYARCIVGIELSFRPRSSQVVALALRHAMLPKASAASSGVQCVWVMYGKPTYLYTDGASEFGSIHIAGDVADALALTTALRNRPAEGGIVERPFRTFDDDFFASLPGFYGAGLAQRPQDAEKNAALTLDELRQQLVRYIVDNYNQHLDARSGRQSRRQRWEAGLPGAPELIPERELDVCLMKVTRRIIYKGGYIHFENLTYRSLAVQGYEGLTVTLRFNPDDITTILVYRSSGDRDVFLATADAQGLETERISQQQAKALARHLRAAGKPLTNQSIYDERRAREAFVRTVERERPQRRGRGRRIIPRPSNEPAVMGPAMGPAIAVDGGDDGKDEDEDGEATTGQTAAGMDTPAATPFDILDLDDLRRDYWSDG